MCRHSSFWRGLTAHWTELRTLIVVLASLAGMTSARADVWTYVDPQGMAHFSTMRVDDSYEMFLRGSDSFSVGNSFAQGALDLAGDADAPAGGAAGRDAVARSAATVRLLAYFDISPNYKAVKHLLREASLTHGIDYELLQALIATESGFDARAVSPKGAVGLMQLIAPTAARYGVKAEKNSPIEQKLTDPKTNIRAGATYLRDLINMFPGKIELAIAAYNAGEGAVQRAGNKIPNYPETRNYVKNVMQLYTQLRPSQPTARTIAAGATGRIRMEMPAPTGRSSGLALNAPGLLSAQPGFAGALPRD
jgi:Transglycosylase SLT domain